MKYVKNIVAVYLALSFSHGQKTFIHAGKLIDGVTDIPIEIIFCEHYLMFVW